MFTRYPLQEGEECISAELEKRDEQPEFARKNMYRDKFLQVAIEEREEEQHCRANCVLLGFFKVPNLRIGVAR